MENGDLVPPFFSPLALPHSRHLVPILLPSQRGFSFHPFRHNRKRFSNLISDFPECSLTWPFFLTNECLVNLRSSVSFPFAYFIAISAIENRLLPLSCFPPPTSPELPVPLPLVSPFLDISNFSLIPPPPLQSPSLLPECLFRPPNVSTLS